VTSVSPKNISLVTLPPKTHTIQEKKFSLEIRLRSYPDKNHVRLHTCPPRIRITFGTRSCPIVIVLALPHYQNKKIHLPDKNKI
jgi:hypothetical protein